MNCNGPNRLKLIPILVFVFYLFITSGLAYAQDGEADFLQGKTDLENFLLVDAYTHFGYALKSDPDQSSFGCNDLDHCMPCCSA